MAIPAGTPQAKLLELKKLLDENIGLEKITLDFEADPEKFELSKKILAKQKVRWSENLELQIKDILV